MSVLEFLSYGYVVLLWMLWFLWVEKRKNDEEISKLAIFTLLGSFLVWPVALPAYFLFTFVLWNHS